MHFRHTWKYETLWGLYKCVVCLSTRQLSRQKSLGQQDIAFVILRGPPHWECGSGEVWEIMTLILSKTDGLINTGGILPGSRPLQWECTWELDCQDTLFPTHHYPWLCSYNQYHRWWRTNVDNMPPSTKSTLREDHLTGIFPFTRWGRVRVRGKIFWSRQCQCERVLQICRKTFIQMKKFMKIKRNTAEWRNIS